MIILLKNHLSDTSFHQLKQFSVLKNSQAFVELNQTPSNVKCKQPSNQIIRSVQSRRGGVLIVFVNSIMLYEGSYLIQFHFMAKNIT